MVGNMSDLATFGGERAVSQEEGNTFAASAGCPWMETSAKEKHRVEDPFFELVRRASRRSFAGRRQSVAADRKYAGDRTFARKRDRRTLAVRRIRSARHISGHGKSWNLADAAALVTRSTREVARRKRVGHQALSSATWRRKVFRKTHGIQGAWRE